ncbi:translation initiation factor IF-2 N-terminal domain-containing protein [Pseudonocardia endophytica]|uniref:Ribonuclease E n=1 Tax=Pseudonocardia endophytica TaxID=401976 RepID=A0A4R1HN02_PSEEN|nr:translation initiation factor IF-2 N-terminal domain-containing protein [Pseudonocardia endophytica]TCK21049.1 ribonuclease E [Pseudonocardia endophytica]
MSIDDSPAGETGGQSGVSGPTTPDLPEKLRVHALARLVGRTSKQVLSALSELGQEVRSAQSSVTRATAEQVIAALGGVAEAVPGLGEQEAAPAAAAAPEEPAAPDPSPEASQLGTPATDAQTDDTPDLAALAAAVAPPADAPAKRAAGLAPVFNAAPMFQAPGSGSAATAPAADGETAEVESADRAKPSGKSGRGKRGRKKDAEPAVEEAEETAAQAEETAAQAEDEDASEASGDGSEDDSDDDGGARRRRRRGRRGRGRGRGADGEETDGEDGDDTSDSSSDSDDESGSTEDSDSTDSETDDSSDGGGSKRRRRRRRRGGSDNGDDRGDDDPPNTVTKVRQPRTQDKDSDSSDDGVQGVRGSTRLEAKRQRRRDGRDAGRRRPPILSESEFLARRESVDRSMVIRQLSDRTEIGVLEDDVLVEHFITGGRSGDGSMVGNIYLGRVQNVLPSMEAAFVDIGRGRNAVLYAGEVNWDAAGLNGKARKIEQALSSGDQVLVQVTKDPVGHKGARLTTQISLAGRFLVYVPVGSAAGISRKLPDTERKRLKDMLKEIVPSDAGVIIRTASEGVSHEALERDVRRLQAQWEVVKEKSEKTGKGAPKAPTLLYEEPDMLVKVVRDQFNEDFSRLIISGDDAWDTVAGYVQHVAPELSDRMHRHTGTSDVFTEHRIDEQLLKALDRKVWLPSGGTLVIDRTEAMTVVDVNTGKFTGSGGNLEETVTRNNLEAAEEVVRQLRLRDIGGIIVVDFIDMVLEANRDLVLRRLTECLARDRTRHQVAEVTSLGLVQMTRKRVGGGLLEHFSTPCEHCRGRGVIVSTDGTLSGGHDHGHSGNGNGHNGNGQNGQNGSGNGNGQNGSGDGNGRRSRSRGRRGGGDRQPVEVDTSSAVAGVALVEAASRVNRSAAETDGSVAVETAAAGTADAVAATASTTGPDAEVAAVTPSVTVPEEPSPAAPAGSAPAAETAPAAEQGAATAAEPVPASEPMPEPVTAPAAAESTVEDAGHRNGDGAADEPAQRRRRGRVVRSAGSPAATAEPVVITTSASEPEPPAAPPPPVAPQPEPPTVATRTRRPRRAASRPAGPPPAEAEPGDSPQTGGNGESDPV